MPQQSLRAAQARGRREGLEKQSFGSETIEGFQNFPLLIFQNPEFGYCRKKRKREMKNLRYSSFFRRVKDNSRYFRAYQRGSEYLVIIVSSPRDYSGKMRKRDIKKSRWSCFFRRVKDNSRYFMLTSGESEYPVIIVIVPPAITPEKIENAK